MHCEPQPQLFCIVLKLASACMLNGIYAKITCYKVDQPKIVELIIVIELFLATIIFRFYSDTGVSSKLRALCNATMFLLLLLFFFLLSHFSFNA